MSRQPRTARRRILPTLAAVAVAAVTSVAATVAPASAASMKVRFTIDHPGSFTPVPDARAVIPMGQYEVWGYLNNGAHARVQLFGDDSLRDDLLLTTGWAYLGPGIDGVYLTGTSEGIVVTWRTPVSYHLLDEDFFDDDEVYVKVTVIDGDGRTLAQANSSVYVLRYVY